MGMHHFWEINLLWSLKVWIWETMGVITWVCHHLITVGFQVAADDLVELFHGQTGAAEIGIWTEADAVVVAWRWRKGDSVDKESVWAPTGGMVLLHHCCTPRWVMSLECHALLPQRGFLKHLKCVEWLSNMLAAPSAKGSSIFVETQGFFSTKQ